LKSLRGGFHGIGIEELGLKGGEEGVEGE